MAATHEAYEFPKFSYLLPCRDYLACSVTPITHKAPSWATRTRACLVYNDRAAGCGNTHFDLLDLPYPTKPSNQWFWSPVAASLTKRGGTIKNRPPLKQYSVARTDVLATEIVMLYWWQTQYVFYQVVSMYWIDTARLTILNLHAMIFPERTSLL